METTNTWWENEPRAGWAEFESARQRVADLMWIDTQLHNATRSRTSPADRQGPRSSNDRAAHPGT